VTHESGTIHGVSVSEETWYSVHDALPAGSYIGRPSYHDERREWVMYAYDPSERLQVGLRSREWAALGESEEDVVLGRLLAGELHPPVAALAWLVATGAGLQPLATSAGTWLAGDRHATAPASPVD